MSWFERKLLKYFSGDVSLGGDLSVSGDTTIDGSLQINGLINVNITSLAATGTMQSDAALITGAFTAASGAVNAGVKLPLAASGKHYVVLNANSSNALKVWPNTGDAIAGLGVNNSLTISAMQRFDFLAINATTWLYTAT